MSAVGYARVWRPVALILLALPTWREPAPAATLDQLSATRDRPLFSPTRRPPPAADAGPPPAAPVASGTDIRLKVVILGSDRTVAIVTQGGDPKALSVEVGSHVGSWTVQRIAARSIVLRRNDETTTVALPEPGP